MRYVFKKINVKPIAILYSLIAFSLFKCTLLHAAPITFNTALPVGKGEIVWRQQLITSQARSDNGSARRRKTNLVSTLAYGITPDLTVFASTGLTDKSLISSSGLRRSNFGLTDSSLTLRYSAYRSDFTGGTVRFAPIIGVEIPTGDDQESDSLGQLPRNLQSGSGTTDYFVGGVFTYSKTDWGFDVQFLHRENGQNQDFRSGDITRLDLSLRKLLISTSNYFLNGLIEFNLTDQDANTINNQVDNASDSTTVFVSPGIQYITQTWIIESSVQLPLSNRSR